MRDFGECLECCSDFPAAWLNLCGDKLYPGLQSQIPWVRLHLEGLHISEMFKFYCPKSDIPDQEFAWYLSDLIWICDSYQTPAGFLPKEKLQIKFDALKKKWEDSELIWDNVFVPDFGRIDFPF